MQIWDPGWKKFGSGMEKIRIRDKHLGSATLNYTGSGSDLFDMKIGTRYRTIFYYKYFLRDFLIFFVLYSTLLHMPPLRFHCADGRWDRTQDRGNWCIVCQTL